MNPIVEEINSYFGCSKMNDEEFIMHYGKGHLDGGHSGRYAWGSGEDPYQHSVSFLGRIENLKKEGWKETPENIEKEFGLSVKEYRMEKSICNDEKKIGDINRAIALRDEGCNNREIGRKMGVNESTVRGWFKQQQDSKMLQTRELADKLKKIVDEKEMVDVGIDVEKELNVSREKMDTAIYLLEREGYHAYSGRIPQITNKNQLTTQKVLCKPGISHGEIYDFDRVKTIKDYISRDNGITLEKKFTYPASMDSNRLKIRYAEDGGIDKDGLIEIRRGVDDLSLGKSLYSQVRILVDNSHYIKGMAVYSDDMPDGVDVVFNTNKDKSKSKLEVLKKIKDDPDNPFGSTIKDCDQGGQYWYVDKKTGKKKLGLINKRADEGDWSDWQDTLPSQFLSKQSKQLAKKQLDLARSNKEAEFDEIMSLNNPTVKKYYLKKFADTCDKAAEDLKAAALPGQKYHVIIPNNTLKDNEVYAPGYENGTKLALIRYPHGGIFEIPICTVNNKNKLGQKILSSTPLDAICINHKIAEQLSGADFDGDTVMCIPTHDKNNRVKISSTKPLEGLKNFDPGMYQYDKKTVDPDGTEHYYRMGKEFKPMNNQLKQKEMGKVSNLISDMTLAGANNEQIAKAVRHSMVVIDAEKHKYDYKQSEIDNDIDTLKKQWQTKYDDKGNPVGGGGASTIISKAKGPVKIPRRKGEAKINIKGKPWYDKNRPEGALIYTQAPDNELYYADSKLDRATGIRTVKTTSGKSISYNVKDPSEKAKYDPVMKKDSKTGEVYFTSKDGTLRYRTNTRTMDSSKMAETDDAYTLVSRKRHPMELLYADYANSMKALANNARIEMVNTGNLKYNPDAKGIYKNEIKELETKLNESLKNAPKERAVLRMTNVKVKKMRDNDPSMSDEDARKAAQRAMTKYREELGSSTRKERSIKITDKEWEAIQAGAISENKLKIILNNTDPDSLRERAMPKDSNTLSKAQINRIKRLQDSNFTLDEIAKKIGISRSSVSYYLKGD